MVQPGQQLQLVWAVVQIVTGASGNVLGLDQRHALGGEHEPAPPACAVLRDPNV
jgi:hypothetical protein